MTLKPPPGPETGDVEPPDMAISPERVFFILTKAREFDAKEELSDPASGSNPADDGIIDVLESSRDDSTYEEFLGAMRALNLDEQLDLVTLLWIGRGDFEPSEWNEARGQASAMRTKHIPDYIASTPMAGDFLENALTALGYSIEEYEIERL
ncbi:MAG: DUF3775 domain-containing protein [Alphaproteobacteria bacterium]